MSTSPSVPPPDDPIERAADALRRRPLPEGPSEQTVVRTLAGLDTHFTFSDIQLDPKLDDALFSLDPPAGYTLRKVGATLVMSPEEAVVRLLRTYADITGGTFPIRVDDIAANQKVFSTRKAKSDLDSAAFELAAASAQVAVFCQTMKNHYGYKPEGVKLGAADKIIFWYKPEGQTKYRVVYGDLHTGDVAADQLPEKPKP